MSVYPIILLSLNQALVCSASLSAHPVGSDDLSDQDIGGHIDDLGGHAPRCIPSPPETFWLVTSSTLNEKLLMTKEEKRKCREKKKKMTFMLLEVRYSFQHPGASAKYSHVTHPAETRGRLGHVVQGAARTVPSSSSKLLLSKSV